MSISFLKSLYWLTSTVSCLLHFYKIISVINQILITRTRYLLMIFTFLHMNYQKDLCVIQIQTRTQALIVWIILQTIHINLLTRKKLRISIIKLFSLKKCFNHSQSVCLKILRICLLIHNSVISLYELYYFFLFIY